MLVHEETTNHIIGAAIDVHRVLGPGLLESAYEPCIAHELESRGLHVERQAAFPIRYKGLDLDAVFRPDLIVDDRVIVELKSVEAITRIHGAQLVTYLRVANKPVGLVLNFGAARMSDGILRRVLSNVVPDES